MTVPPPEGTRRGADFQWLDAAAGPVVRPYAMTGGRTRYSQSDFDLIAVIVTLATADAYPGPAPGAIPSRDVLAVGPEQESILELCRSPLSVAEVASELDLPVGVVRVLLGDLLENELILLRRPAPVAQSPNAGVLKEVIHGLHAL